MKNQLPSNGGQSLDDFVLMTSFPQRRISDMENTLESAGELIDYIQILLSDFHGFYIIHLEVCILIDPFLWCSGLRFFPNTWFTFVWLIWNGYNRIAGKMIIIALLFCLCILIFHLDRCTSFVSSGTICYSIISLTIYILYVKPVIPSFSVHHHIDDTRFKTG